MTYYYKYNNSPGNFCLTVTDSNGKTAWMSQHPAYISNVLTGDLMPDDTPIDQGVMKNLDDVKGLELHLKRAMVLSDHDTLVIADFSNGGDVKGNNKFRIRNDDGTFTDASGAKPVKVPGSSRAFFVIKKDNGVYVIYDAVTGAVTDNNSFSKTIKEAVSNLLNKTASLSIPLDELLSRIEKRDSEASKNSIFNQSFDLRGNQKEEYMYPIVRDASLASLKVDDTVIVTLADGKRQEMSFRGIAGDNAVVYNRAIGQLSVNKSQIAPINFKIISGYLDSILYAMENGLFEQDIADGKIAANDVVKIIQSAGQPIPESITNLSKKSFAAGGVSKEGNAKQKNEKYSNGGSLDEENKPAAKRGGSYHDRVVNNIRFMGTQISDWRAVPIKGMQKTTDDKGDEVEMPVFEFPAGYTNAISMYPTSASSPCCELCGKTPIKKLFWIQNDIEKKTLSVGSECVKYVGEGLTGKENIRKAKVQLAKMLDNDLGRLAKLLFKKMSRIEDRGYGRKERTWRTSFIGEGGNNEYWISLKNRMAALNPETLFDPKKLNRSNKDTIYWAYVHKKLPYFGWESEMNYAGASEVAQSNVESKLLSWFTKNEDLSVLMIKQIIETLKIIGVYEEGEYNSDFLDTYDKSLTDKPEFEEGGEIKSDSIVKTSPVNDDMGYAYSWLLDNEQFWELVKYKGSQIIILTKTGKAKRVKVKEVKSHAMPGSGRYLTVDGAEYMSLMDEWKYNIIPRAIKFQMYPNAVKDGLITEEQGRHIINSAYSLSSLLEKGGHIHAIAFHSDWNYKDLTKPGAYYDYDEIGVVFDQIQSPLYKVINWANEGGDPQVFYTGYDISFAKKELNANNVVSGFDDQEQVVVLEKVNQRFDEGKLKEIKALYKSMDQDGFEEKFPDIKSIADFIDLDVFYEHEEIDSFIIPAINDKSRIILFDVQKHFGGKYSTHKMPNGKSLEIRIADHSGKHKNVRGDLYLSVVIANLNKTENFKKGATGMSNEIYFNDTMPAEEIISVINDRISEIIQDNQPSSWEEAYIIQPFKDGTFGVFDHDFSSVSDPFETKKQAEDFAKDLFDKKSFQLGGNVRKLKTKLPKSIKTLAQAKKYLTNLYNNDESYHPEDGAGDSLDGISDKDAEHMDVLMNQVYEVFNKADMDPAEFLVNLSGHTIEDDSGFEKKE